MGSGGKGKGLHAFFHVDDAPLTGLGTRPELADGGEVLRVGFVEALGADGGVVGGVEGGVVIAGDDEFELCGVGGEERVGGEVLSQRARHGQVTGVDQDGD